MHSPQGILTGCDCFGTSGSLCKRSIFAVVVSAHGNDLQKSQLQPLPDSQPLNSKNVPDSKFHGADAFHCCHCAALCALSICHEPSAPALRKPMGWHQGGAVVLQQYTCRAFWRAANPSLARHGQMDCACVHDFAKCTIKHGKQHTLRFPWETLILLSTVCHTSHCFVAGWHHFTEFE